jgi:hypothetical protein
MSRSKGATPALAPTRDDKPPDENGGIATLRAKIEEASSILLQSGASSFMSRLGLVGTPPGYSLNGGVVNNNSSLNSQKLIGTAKTNIASTSSNNTLPNGYFVNLQSTGSNNTYPAILLSETSINIPSHPAAVCLEALLSLLLSDVFLHLLESEHGVRLMEFIFIRISLNVSTLLNSAMRIESNLRLL